ncbi:hypothetical protein ACMFMG_004143 [Clarireedia jacksonii]
MVERGPSKTAAAAEPGAATRRRAFFPKVKSGCFTCKKRRIKCDEGRPACQKCITTGFKCDGYPSGPAGVGSGGAPETRLRSTAARRVSRSKMTGLNTVGTKLKLIRPRSTIVETEQENRYFRSFIEKTSQRISGFYHSKIWSKIMLQSAEREPPIRHALIAIAALDMMLQVGEMAQGSRSRVYASMIEGHHVFALQQYSKALNSKTVAMAGRRHTLKADLLFCLVTICFEAIYGAHESARSHMDVGLRLIETIQQDHTLKRKRFPKMEAITQNSLKSLVTFGISSPIPSELEDEIYQAFGLLEISNMSFRPDSRGMPYHMLAKDSGAMNMQKMPSTFADIIAAKTYWDLIMRRLMHLMPTLLGAHQPLYENSKHVSPTTSPRMIAAIKEQQKYLKELASWWSAFSPVLEKCRGDPDSKEFAGATMLHSRWIICHMALSFALTPAQTALDDRIADFRKVLGLAKSVLSHPARAGKFTFETGVMPQIYVVAIKCRDYAIRSEAVALLTSSAWREGIWDSSVAGGAAKSIVAIEEQGREDGYLPEHKRVVQTAMEVNLRRRTGSVKCYLNSQVPPMERPVMVKHFKW